MGTAAWQLVVTRPRPEVERLCDELADYTPERNTVTEVRTPWGPVAVVAATHPSRNWAAHTSGKWQELEPVLGAARRLVLAGS